MSYLELVHLPGSTQPLPTVETNPHVENIELDSDVEIKKVVPGNLFQEDILDKTEHQSENSDNEINVSEDIPTSKLKKVITNETQAKSTHGKISLLPNLKKSLQMKHKLKVHMVQLLALIVIIAAMTCATSTI